MRIRNIGLALPSRKVTNDEVIALIREHTTDFQGDLEHTLDLFGRMLSRTGLRTRRWMAPGERSIDYTINACREAMAQLEPGEKIDLLIYASVYGEMVEPSTSNYIAAKLGLADTECVDMKAACDGWMKAARSADIYLSSGLYQRILVVTAEFSMVPGYALFPGLFKLNSAQDLDHRFPGFTIGESATATIFERDDYNPWSFTNKTRNDLVDLCTVTPTWHVAYQGDSEKIAKDGPGIFTSWAKELSGHGIPLAIQTFREAGIAPETVDILFTHCSSWRDWSLIAKAVDLQDKLYDIYRDIGNVVSCGVPTALAMAIKEGKLRPDDSVAVLVASAGMSFSTAKFQF